MTAIAADTHDTGWSLQSPGREVNGDIMSQDIVHVVEQLLARAPQWIRQDLLSNDPLARRRAEETLAAMIAAALASDQEPGETLSITPSSEIGLTGA